MRYLLAALLLPACTLPTLPEPPHGGVVFQTDDALLLDAELGADQFRPIYPHDIEVTTLGADDDTHFTSRIQLVPAGFIAPGDDRPMCQFGVVGTARIAGLTDHNSNVWICDDLSTERRREVVLHEMCHVFGAPGHPHWNQTDGACGRGDNVVISDWERKEFKWQWK